MQRYGLHRIMDPMQLLSNGNSDVNIFGIHHCIFTTEMILILVKELAALEFCKYLL